MQIEQIIDNLLSCNDLHTITEDGTHNVERVAPKSAMLIAARTILLQQRQLEELSAVIMRASGEGFNPNKEHVVEEVQ